MKDFSYNRNYSHKISRERIIEELERVAELFDYKDFTKSDFNSVSEISYDTVYREFGSWENVMNFLIEHLERKHITFLKVSRRANYTEKEMLDEMQRIWTLLGHRPSRDEWTSHMGVPSYDTLYRHFGSWEIACKSFIEYKTGEKFLSNKKTAHRKKVRSVSQKNKVN